MRRRAWFCLMRRRAWFCLMRRRAWLRPARRRRRQLLGGDGAIPAGPLGGIERGIGGADHRLHGGAALRPGGDADRDGDPWQGAVLAVPHGPHQAAELFGPGQRIGLGAVRHQHQQFLAAIAAGDIHAAQLGHQQRAHLAQHRIAGGMAVAVVDQLEMVEVDQQDGDRRAAPLRMGDQAGQSLLQEAAVVEAGQIVAQRHHAQPLAQRQIRQRQRDAIGQRMRQRHALRRRQLGPAGVELQHAMHLATRQHRQAEAAARAAGAMLAGQAAADAAFMRPPALQRPAIGGREMVRHRGRPGIGTTPGGQQVQPVARIVEDVEGAVDLGQQSAGGMGDHPLHILRGLAGLQQLAHAEQRRHVAAVAIHLAARGFRGAAPPGQLGERGQHHPQHAEGGGAHQPEAEQLAGPEAVLQRVQGGAAGGNEFAERIVQTIRGEAPIAVAQQGGAGGVPFGPRRLGGLALHPQQVLERGPHRRQPEREEGLLQHGGETAALLAQRLRRTKLLLQVARLLQQQVAELRAGGAARQQQQAARRVGLLLHRQRLALRLQAQPIGEGARPRTQRERCRHRQGEEAGGQGWAAGWQRHAGHAVSLC